MHVPTNSELELSVAALDEKSLAAGGDLGLALRLGGRDAVLLPEPPELADLLVQFLQPVLNGWDLGRRGVLRMRSRRTG
jgi:hypothetical protein